MPHYYKHSGPLYPASHYMMQNRACRMPHIGTTPPADLQVRVSDMQGSSSRGDGVACRVTEYLPYYHPQIRSFNWSNAASSADDRLQHRSTRVYSLSPRRDKLPASRGGKQIFMTGFISVQAKRKDRAIYCRCIEDFSQTLTFTVGPLNS